jgi:hypothetical protein
MEKKPLIDQILAVAEMVKEAHSQELPDKEYENKTELEEYLKKLESGEVEVVLPKEELPGAVHHQDLERD